MRPPSPYVSATTSTDITRMLPSDCSVKAAAPYSGLCVVAACRKRSRNSGYGRPIRNPPTSAPSTTIGAFGNRRDSGPSGSLTTPAAASPSTIMASPIRPKAIIDWALRAEMVPGAAVAVENCGIRVPTNPTSAPYAADTGIMPTAIQASGRAVCRSFSRRELTRPTIGPTAPNTAMLQAVKELTRPVTNANSTPDATPAIGVLWASWPSRALAVLTPISVSTSFEDHA